GLDMQQKALLALELNQARRHLNPDEIADLRDGRKRQARMKRGLGMCKQGVSPRAVAAKEGGRDTAGRKDPKKAGADGGADEDPPDGKVIGKDGKKRTAKRKKPAPASTGKGKAASKDDDARTKEQCGELEQALAAMTPGTAAYDAATSDGEATDSRS